MRRSTDTICSNSILPASFLGRNSASGRKEGCMRVDVAMAPPIGVACHQRLDQAALGCAGQKGRPFLQAIVAQTDIFILAFACIAWGYSCFSQLSTYMC